MEGLARLPYPAVMGSDMFPFSRFFNFEDASKATMDSNTRKIVVGQVVEGVGQL